MRLCGDKGQQPELGWVQARSITNGRFENVLVSVLRQGRDAVRMSKNKKRPLWSDKHSARPRVGVASHASYEFLIRQDQCPNLLRYAVRNTALLDPDRLTCLRMFRFVGALINNVDFSQAKAHIPSHHRLVSGIHR